MSGMCPASLSAKPGASKAFVVLESQELESGKGQEKGDILVLLFSKDRAKRFSELLWLKMNKSKSDTDHP